MSKTTESDLFLTEDGDLAEQDGDFALVHNAEATAQNVRCRLKSSDPEWYMEAICANLEDLLGRENSEETGRLGEELIIKALTADDLISIPDLYVQAVPVDKATIVFFVYFKTDNASAPIGYEVSVNLSANVTIRRVQ